MFPAGRATAPLSPKLLCPTGKHPVRRQGGPSETRLLGGTAVVPWSAVCAALGRVRPLVRGLRSHAPCTAFGQTLKRANEPTNRNAGQTPLSTRLFSQRCGWQRESQSRNSGVKTQLLTGPVSLPGVFTDSPPAWPHSFAHLASITAFAKTNQTQTTKALGSRACARRPSIFALTPISLLPNGTGYFPSFSKALGLLVGRE